MRAGLEAAWWASLYWAITKMSLLFFFFPFFSSSHPSLPLFLLPLSPFISRSLPLSSPSRSLHVFVYVLNWINRIKRYSGLPPRRAELWSSRWKIKGQKKKRVRFSRGSLPTPGVTRLTPENCFNGTCPPSLSLSLNLSSLPHKGNKKACPHWSLTHLTSTHF